MEDGGSSRRRRPECSDGAAWRDRPDGARRPPERARAGDWDTRRIPLEEYAQLCRTQSRFRWITLAAAALVVASMIALVVLGRAFSGILLAAIAAMAWSTFGRPQWKRRDLKSIEHRPSWNIKAE